VKKKLKSVNNWWRYWQYTPWAIKTFSAENFIGLCRFFDAGFLGLSAAISFQFSVKLCTASKNCQKFTKNPFLGIQGRSRSSMLINLKSLSSVLVMINNMCVPICNRFRTRRANMVKITPFIEGYPHLTPSFEKNPRTQRQEILLRKLETLRQPCWKFCDFSLHHLDTVPGCVGRTDRQTDGRLDDG